MNLDTLRKNRGYLKGKLTTIRNFITKAREAEPVPEEVTARLQAAEEIYAKFQGISQQLLVGEGEADPKDQAEDIEFDDRFYTVKAALLQLLDRIKPRAAGPSTSGAVERGDNDTLARTVEQQTQLLERLSTRSNTSVRDAQVKLPLIKLLTFDGNIEEWKRYSDTFKTLIHDSELSGVQRHQYLVGSLSGPAAKIIELIEISETNYLIAWELLQKRYDDERGLKKRHIQCLLDELPKVKHESATAIQDLVDHVQKHLRVLQAMKLPTDAWGDIIIYMIEKNLDNTTRRRWEEYIESKEEIGTSTMIEFLQKHSQLLRRTALEGDGKSKGESCERDKLSGQRRPGVRLQSRTTLATTTQEHKCYLCQGQHFLYTCKRFLSLSIEDRIKEIKRLKLCLNCLRQDHFARNCRFGTCKECGERHNTLCHIRKRITGAVAGVAGGAAESSKEDPTAATLCSISSCGREASGARSAQRSSGQRKQVLMATAIVNIKTKDGHSQLRVLLDSASELNFVTSAACKKLNLNLDNIQERISGLNGMSCTIDRGCQLSVKSRSSDFELSLYCLVVPKITKYLPSFSIEASKLSIPENIKLADPFFFDPGKIDVLIGSEFFLQLMDSGRIELGSDLPTLQNTKFGWIIAGSVPSRLISGRANGQLSLNYYTCLFTQQTSIEKGLKKFWELEEYVDRSAHLSEEEQACEKHFTNTTIRDPASGRFVVRLPFRKNKNQLGNSREIVAKRLYCLERKFQRNHEFRDQYNKFMHEYIDLNHMSLVSEDDGASHSIFLPHHGVVRESSTTTKLRVVFDASAKTTSGLSLNDTLMVGSNLQDNIVDIIMRFRMSAVAVTADLRKIYRQILVNPIDRDYQKILWRFSSTEPINEYQLNTVTYGQACAPFLAVRCVRQLANDKSGEFSAAAKVLLNDLYVDDIITSVDSEEEARQLIYHLRALLQKGGFDPHKWRTNSEEISRELQASNIAGERSALAIEASEMKILGLNWCPRTDTFQFVIDSFSDSVTTKREVLSAISRLFDPLGLMSPILIRAKLIMQQTWSSGLDWDETLTGDLRRAWDAYAEDLRGAGSVQVPRRVVRCSDAMRFILHAFCDASLKAYGACIYLQTINRRGNSDSLLLCSKSRVAPVKNKTITLPRLELCGAVVLVRLLRNVKRALRVEFDKVHAWSDSTIVLAWIAGDPSRQKTFVSNRIAEIQSTLSPKHWHHVSGSENPADLVSRGTNLDDLRRNKIWWEGPEWLSRFAECERRKSLSPRLTEKDERLVQAEQAANKIFINVSEENVINSLLENYSSLSKIERIVAWIKRFKSNAITNRRERDYGHISVTEVCRARRTLIREIQKIHFADAISSLQAGKCIKANSKLLPISPFLDNEGMLRVGGRLQNSQLKFENKHPIILPSNSKFTQLLFKQDHYRLLHIGPQALLYSIRENYWPLRGKNIARKTIHDYVICFRNKPKPSTQIMGQLPADRLIPRRPFFVIGIDFAGPITTLVNRGRGRKTNKSYIAVFMFYN